MATPAQIAANIANAEHSTGPKTEAGKQRSKLNAFRHGLTGQVLILTEEDRVAFAALSNALLEDLAPQGALETKLAESIVSDTFRLDRIRSIESAIFALGIEGSANSVDTGNPQIDAAFANAQTWLGEAKNLQL